MAEYFTTSDKGSVMFVGSSRVNYLSTTSPFALNINEAIWKNFSHIGGEFVLEAQLKTSGYSSCMINFGDPALNLMAHGYQVTEDITLSGDYNISTDITITNNATVTISNGTKIHFDTNGKFIIDEGASMVVGNNVIISRISENSDIRIYGDMELMGSLTSEANIHIHEGGSFVTNSNARLKLTSDAGILVEQGGTFTLDNCATYEQVSDGILQVKANANLCISPNAILDVPGHSAFNISSQANIPENCINPFHVVPPSYKITQSNQTWNGVDYRMDRDLEIRPGANLTLQEVNLRFQNNRRIVVHANGVLNLEGGVLTNHSATCHDNKFWNGIKVLGNSDLPQTYQNQGALIISNGAKIENAIIGIQVGSRFFSIPGDQGGIIQANNAQFLNNRRDIEFNSYQNTGNQGQPIDNISHFHHCSFTTNDNSLFSTHYENVKLSGVQGVVFNYAQFSDSRTNLSFTTDANGRTGIMGSNATFMVYNSDFDHLQYGIYATSSNPNRYFRVYNSDFSSYRGIYFNGMDHVTIKNNQFLVKPGYEYPDFGCMDTYGIYIDQSANFAIENNMLHSSSNGSTHCGSLGIIARNTGNMVNEIYRNNLAGFSIAIEAIGQNKGTNAQEGLLLQCNIFEENAYDIYVSPGKIHSRPSGIRELQGYATNPNTTTLAGNLFGNDSQILIANFVNDSEFISYFHHDLNQPRVKPAIYKGDFFFYPMPFEYVNNLSCPVRPDLTPYAHLATQKQQARAQYEETSQLLQAYVDDGDTQLMSQQVEMAGAGDAYTTYQYLMQTSPYLSEEVLELLAAKEEGFNKAMIRDVLVQNPQAAKSQEVNLALDDRLDQLPAYMRWQIQNGLYTLGEKEVMEHFKAYQMNQYTEAFNEIIQGVVYQKDGFKNAPDLDQLLAQADDIRYQYLRAEWQFAREDYAAGLQLLNQIEEQLPNTPGAMQAHMEQVAFYTLLDQWHNHEDHPGFTQLPQDVLVQLEDFLDATPRIAAKALSLLMLNDAIDYQEPIYYPNEVMTPKSGAPATTQRILPDTEDYTQEFHFSLYPNPAKEYITLNWCIDSPRLAETGVIEIRNASGVLVHTHKTQIPCDQQILSLAPWSSGTYTATISLENNMRKTITFIVAQ